VKGKKGEGWGYVTCKFKITYLCCRLSAKINAYNILAKGIKGDIFSRTMVEHEWYKRNKNLINVLKRRNSYMEGELPSLVF
jgi:hypothetical protein